MFGEIEKFVKLKKLWAVAQNIIQYCKTPDDEKNTDSFADQVVEAETYAFDDDLGFSFMDDPERLYEDVIKNEKIYGTGVKALDELLKGGSHEKALHVILAGTNIGKTMAMCSLSTSMLKAGYNVLYITFEDSENKIAKRVAQNLFDLTQDELKLMSREDYIKCWNKYKLLIKQNLRIKEFPEDCTNAMQLSAFIKKLIERKKFTPDIVFIDYIGCMIPNGRMNANINTNTKLQLIAMQTRAISMKFGFPIWTGAQLNREGYGSASVDLNNVADSFAQMMKADGILAFTQSPEYLANGYFDVEIVKTRFGNNKHEHRTVRVDIDKQRIFDIENDESTSNNTTVADVLKNNAETALKCMKQIVF